MNEPRVESLSYAVSSAAHTQYKNPKPQDFHTALGRFLLVDGRLTFWPDENFGSVEDARAAVEPYLRDWEIHAALKFEHGVIQFRFDSGQVVDLRPVGPGLIAISSAVSSVTFADAALAIATKGTYPDPPTDFRSTTEVELAVRRWWNYKAGLEPLPGAAYLIYTILAPTEGRNKDEAAALFAIDKEVLRKLSELSSKRGDESSVRKVDNIARLNPLSDTERAWLEAAIVRIIRRLGEHAAGAPLSQIAMADLPAL